MSETGQPYVLEVNTRRDDRSQSGADGGTTGRNQFEQLVLRVLEMTHVGITPRCYAISQTR